MNHKANFHIIVVLLVFSLVYFAGLSLEGSQSMVFGVDGGLRSLPMIDLASVLLVVAINAFFYGLLTLIVLSKSNSENRNFSDFFVDIRWWLPRSFATIIAGWGGFYFFSLMLIQIRPNGIFSFLATFVSGVWITLTFLLFPTMLYNRQTFGRALRHSLMTSLKTAPRFLHLILLLFLVSGGFVYLWLPDEIALHRELSNSGVTDWIVHFQWIGGYSFTSNWYLEYTKALSVNSSNSVLTFLFFLNSVVATLVKLRVTNALNKLGYLYP